MFPRKKILIFIDWFSPGYKAGGPISSNENLIDHLKDEFDFYVITRDTDYCESIPYPEINSDTWNILQNGTHVFYVSQKKLSFSHLLKIIKSISFDLVYVNGTYSYYFSLFPLIWFKYFSKKELVVATRGMASDHSFSSKKTKKKLFYFLARILGLYNGISFHATNFQEAQNIRRTLNFKGNIKIAANLSPKTPQNVSYVSKQEGILNLISIARISIEKNTLFALEILSKCYSGKIILDLFGTVYDESYWHKCQLIIQSLPANVHVSYKGSISKNLIPLKLQEYHFLFLPSLGENYGHSIAECLMAARPVIISDQTPWRNLQNIDHWNKFVPFLTPFGWDLPLNKIEPWIDVINFAINMNQEEFNNMCNSASAVAMNYINSLDVIKSNIEIFK